MGNDGSNDGGHHRRSKSEPHKTSAHLKRAHSQNSKCRILNRDHSHLYEEEEPSYCCLDLWATVLGIIFYFFDVSSDSYVAYLHYMDGHYWWFALSVTFIALSAVVMSLFSLWWYIDDYRSAKNERRKHGSKNGVQYNQKAEELPLNGRRTDGEASTNPRAHADMIDCSDEDFEFQEFPCSTWFCRGMFLMMLVSPVVRYGESLYNGCCIRYKDADDRTRRKWFRHMIYEDRDSLLLRLVECFAEAAPQLILQLYIMAVQGAQEGLWLVLVQIVSCISSLSSLAWSLASYQRALKRTIPVNRQMNLYDVIVQFCWRFCVIGCRVIAMAYFAAVMTYWLFIVMAVHFVAMFVWIRFQKTNFSETNRSFLEICYNLVISIIHVFCFFNVSEGGTFLRYLIFYSVVYVENLGMVLGAWMYKSEPIWYDGPVILFVALVFFLGVIIQLYYYQYVHPKNNVPQKETNCYLCISCTAKMQRESDVYGERGSVEDLDMPKSTTKRNSAPEALMVEYTTEPEAKSKVEACGENVPEYVFETAC